MGNNNKVAFIGPANIHEAFKAIDDEWDFQQPVESIQEFTEELEKENGKVSSDTSVIVAFSRLYQTDPDNFASLVAYIAPYAAVCILMPSADLSDKESIRRDIEKARDIEVDNDPENYDEKAPYYFIAYENPQADLIDALAQYMVEPHANPSAKDVIKNMIPASAYADDFEQFNEIDEAAYMYIPDEGALGDGKVVAVTSSKGGSGKSTISCILGTYIAKASRDAYENGLADHPLKVCILDLDTRDGQLNLLNGVAANTKNVFNIFVGYTGGEMSEDVVKKGIWHSDKMGLDFIFAVKRPRTAKTTGPGFYAALISRLRTMYDYVIIDTSVNYLDPLLEKVAYPQADKIIFVADMGVSSIFGMARWIQEVTSPESENGSGIDAGKIGIVVNKVLKEVNMEPEKIERAASGLKIISLFPSAPKIITYAANTGSLDQVLNMEQINNSCRRLAEAIVAPSGYTLGNVPFTSQKR